MRQFLTVFGFELKSYFKNKTYILSTVIICAIAIIGLSMPRFINLFDSPSSPSNTPDGVQVSDSEATYVIYDKEHVFADDELFKFFFPNASFTKASSEKELRDIVKKEKADAGFLITSPTSYEYVVNNSSLYNTDATLFDGLMSQNYRLIEMDKQGIDAAAVSQIYQKGITHEEIILGKDSAGNYTYTYVLIFALYMMILMYGQLIAVNVASEKSNRAVEILATSSSSNALIFGKVLAGACASVIQMAVMIICAAAVYEINAELWNHMLDMVFHIPLSVLGSFAAFGILGYLFYSFIYGTLGALVSKTEDINTTSAPMTILFVIVFFITFIGMADIDGMLIKVASYVPFSSFMAMFVRIAMGSVSAIEILVSLLILAVSTILVGIGAAKIYRRGTLMYGNTIKFKHALKFLKRKD